MTSESGEPVATVTFDSVTEAGETTFSELTIGPDAPVNFAIFRNKEVQGGNELFYYDISSTATFEGLVEVCIHYDDTGLTENQEGKHRRALCARAR